MASTYSIYIFLLWKTNSKNNGYLRLCSFKTYQPALNQYLNVQTDATKYRNHRRSLYIWLLMHENWEINIHILSIAISLIHTDCYYVYMHNFFFEFPHIPYFSSALRAGFTDRNCGYWSGKEDYSRIAICYVTVFLWQRSSEDSPGRIL